GQGKPEGGVVPSNLTWEALTIPYGVTHANGRKHPPYTERALELALTRGLDPAGNRLLNVMPRYQMSGADMADLIAYLKRLGKDRDPGIGESSLVVGGLVPSQGALAELGQAVRAVTTGFFSEVNSQGGIYNRRVEVKFAETGETPAATRANVERLLTEEQPFVLTGAFIAGADKEIASLMQERETPLVGPFTLYPQVGFPLNRQVFYLLSGYEGQSRALVNFAAGREGARASGLAIVAPTGEQSERVVAAATAQAKKRAWSAPETYSYASGNFDAAKLAQQTRRKGQSVIIFLGSGAEALVFMKECEKLDWSPALHMVSAGAGREVFDSPAAFNHKIFVSFPTSPADQTMEGVKEFRAFAEKYQLPPHHLVAQISAYAAAKILVEGLKRAGKDASREKLIAALENLNRFETGLLPPVTYGPNRRIGALGAYVVSVDLEKKEFVPASGWIEAD
nr:ABC transporter substrate-binding protein [Acidobacteriota bacterium]